MVKNQASIDIRCYTTFLISAVHINDDLNQKFTIATDFAHSSCIIWHTSASSPGLPSLRMAS